MTRVSKMYDLAIGIKRKFDTRMFMKIFFVISTFALFFGTMNVFAQSSSATDTSSGTVDISNVTLSPDWKGVKTFINLANGVSDTSENNMGSQGTLNLANTAYTAIAIAAPGVTEGAEQIKNSSDVPEDMKAGLVGITDNAATYAYNYYPYTGVTEHLAEEWLPGYKDSNSTAYAADGTDISGYDTLMNAGIAPLWNKVRNIAYVFFVVVMIVVGFMIMFRSKIGGQTVVTLGNFLPGVITSLILITFSFAIAGLLIDIGGMVTSLIAGLYGADNVAGINSLWTIFTNLFVSGTEKVALGSLAGGVGITGVMGLGTLAQIGIAFISSIGGTILAGAGIIALIFGLVIIGIILYGGVKVLITIYKAFFGILLSVVIAPIQIMIGAFPGKGYVTSNWFKSLVKNVLTFPMVFAIVNLPNFIATQSGLDLSLPAKLSYSVNDGMNIGLTGGFSGGLTMFILRVVVLFFAAESPKYLEAWLPADTPKAVAEGLANARASLSKIPVVGSLFK